MHRGAYGVVAIGRNEGARLEACLKSAQPSGAALVYVDSGSTDGSPERARSLGAIVERLDPGSGFTAARARNVGFSVLTDRVTSPEFVQFIDGDCALAPGWIDFALERMAADKGLAAVAGRRRERFPDATIFNRLCDMEWNTPVGEARAVGGDALFRVAAFAEAGGFDPTLICGEEPELCFRLRRRGWRIERLDHDMTLHDAAMTSWRQWFRRTMRGGWAFEEGFSRLGRTAEAYNCRERRSLWLWGGAGPLALALSALAAAVSEPVRPYALGAVGALLLLYGAMMARVALGRRSRFGDPWRRAALYGVMIMLGKVPEMVGAAWFRLRRLRSQPPELIEYKSPEKPGGA
jgi:glycosyltransferase involved in cell wall biosynthesis